MLGSGDRFHSRTGSPAVDEIGQRGGEGLRYREGPPHPLGIPDAAEQEGDGDDDHHIAQGSNDQGWSAHAQPLQRTGGRYGYRGQHKAQADDAQSSGPQGDGLGILGKQAHELAGQRPTQGGAQDHDAGDEGQRGGVDPAHPPVLSGAVVVPHQGTDPLNDTISG